MQIRKLLEGTTATAGLFIMGMVISYPSGRADNDNNGAQDEQQMVQTGLSVAAATGIHLNMTNKDQNLVGLGSYLVNVTSDCNLCHSPVFITSSFGPGGNPYLLPPYFDGRKTVDPTVYLGGNQNFGPPYPGGPSIISRNLTPDGSGLPEGHTLADFMLIMKTGVDMDHAHPNCTGAQTATCLQPPLNGAVLQVMPWTTFQSMTDRQLTAIYTFLSAVPCLVGGPNEPANRCARPATPPKP